MSFLLCLVLRGRLNVHAVTPYAESFPLSPRLVRLEQRQLTIMLGT